MVEPGNAAVQALADLNRRITELIEQRDLWQKRYLQAIKERDAARNERDDHHWRTEYGTNR